MKKKNPKEIKDTLPNKMSDLILVAIRDLSKVEKMKGYKIDMGWAWHEPIATRRGSRCSVCLAGACMVGLGVPKNREVHPYSFNEKLERKFNAIDSLRVGSVSSACYYLNIIKTEKIRKMNRDITDYSVSKSKFKKEMLKLAKDLKKVGS